MWCATRCVAFGGYVDRLSLNADMSRLADALAACPQLERLDIALQCSPDRAETVLVALLSERGLAAPATRCSRLRDVCHIAVRIRAA